MNVIGDTVKNLSGLATGVTEISKSVGGLFSTEDEAQFGSLLNRIARDNPTGVQLFLEFMEWAFPFRSALQQLGRVFYGNGFRKHILSFPNPKNQPPPQSKVTGSSSPPQNSPGDEREEEMRRMILILEQFGNEALLLDIKRRGIPVTPEWIREHDPSKKDPNSTVSKILRAEFIPSTQSFMKLFAIFGVILALLMLLIQCQPAVPYI